MVFAKLLRVMILMALAGGAVAGCNTVDGFGRDVQKAGEKIQSL